MQIQLGEMTVEVEQKDIKNLHLSVYPPTGRVRISAPLRMDLDTIRVFAITKLGWIKSQQKKLREQMRETPREYLDRESQFDHLSGKHTVGVYPSHVYPDLDSIFYPPQSQYDILYTHYY